jgi:indole-3-glycerol phosphate synthase
VSYLPRLLQTTRARIADLRTSTTSAELEAGAAEAEPPRGFRDSLTGEGIAVIAEIKRATPSRGAIAAGLDAGKISQAYAKGGAAAISVLTDPGDFDGSLEDLSIARRVGLPVLRKDFILDRIQILESRAAGADALLLIVRMLGEELEDLIASTQALGMDALVEVFDEVDLARARAAGAQLIGVNHRDLASFEVDKERTAKLAPMLENGTTLVALSGVSTRADVETLEGLGVDAVLVGEALVLASDPASKLRELRGPE